MSSRPTLLVQRYEAARARLRSAIEADDPGGREMLLQELRNLRDDAGVQALLVERLDAGLAQGVFDRLGSRGASAARDVRKCLQLGGVPERRDLKATPMAIGMLRGVLGLLHPTADPPPLERVTCVPIANVKATMTGAAFKTLILEQMAHQEFGVKPGVLVKGIVLPDGCGTVSLEGIAQRNLNAAIASLRQYVDACLQHHPDILEIVLLQALLNHAAGKAKQDARSSLRYRLDPPTWKAVLETSPWPRQRAGDAAASAWGPQISSMARVLAIAVNQTWKLPKLLASMQEAMAGTDDAAPGAEPRARFMRDADVANRAVLMCERPKEWTDDAVLARVEWLVRHIGVGAQIETDRERCLARLPDLIRGEPMEQAMARLDLSDRLYGPG